MSKFEALGLQSEIIQSINSLGFESPTEIQERSIPHILETDQDLIALAQTGTGKTAAFGLPLIQMVDTSSRDIQGLVLCPTRELAIQITKELKSFSTHLPDLGILAVYGGTPISQQIRGLKKRIHIVVGTPGRSLDLIRRGDLDLAEVEWLILDEADEMLNMGFQKDLDAIFWQTPQEKQTLLFSATMPRAMVPLTRKYMSNAFEITVGSRNEGAKDITHAYYMVQAKDRFEALNRLVAFHPEFYGIVFCRTRKDTQWVSRKLNEKGFDAGAIHGDLSQYERDEVMGRFRDQKINILVATDVAARGIDVQELTHVINFELPDDPEVYVHRSGRTGRAGNSGISLSIIHSREGYKIRTLENMVGKGFHAHKVPTGLEIMENQMKSLIEQVATQEPKEELLMPYLPAITERLGEFDREQIIQLFVSHSLSKLMDNYQKARDINVRRPAPSNGRKKEGPRRDIPYTRFEINIGSEDDLNAARLMGLINQRVRKRNMRIGKIQIRRQNAFFEVESRFDTDVMNRFQNAEFDGMPISLKPAKPLQNMVAAYNGNGKSAYNSSGDSKPKKNRRRKRKRK